MRAHELVQGIVAAHVNLRRASRLVNHHGKRDRSKAGEHETTLRAIPGAKLKTVAGGGHFLSLDRPREVPQLIIEFAAS